ncbi:MAG TPA: hypothetical protein VGH14_05795 [Solirubrobacterales bacterium]
MKKSLLILPLVLLVAALTLTACGGGSSSSGDEEGAIAEAVEKSATTSDPSKCTELQTQAFNEQEKATSGKDATKVCEEEAEEKTGVAESVDVSDIKVNGESATAQAEVHGSALNGQTVELELVKESGNWKLNKFLQFAKYDAKQLGESFEKEFSAAGEVSVGLAKCISEGIGKLSQEEAEAVAFEGDIKVVEAMVGECQ